MIPTNPRVPNEKSPPNRKQNSFRYRDLTLSVHIGLGGYQQGAPQHKIHWEGLEGKRVSCLSPSCGAKTRIYTATLESPRMNGFRDVY